MCYCPYCQQDLSEYEDISFIYEYIECNNCHQIIWLDYNEFYDSETFEEYSIFTFLKRNKYDT